MNRFGPAVLLVQTFDCQASVNDFIILVCLWGYSWKLKIFWTLSSNEVGLKSINYPERLHVQMYIQMLMFLLLWQHIIFATSWSLQSTMLSNLFMILFYIFQSLIFDLAEAKSWVRAGYWTFGRDISDINSTLFTHLICGHADIDTSNYEIKISSNDDHCFSGFITTFKQKNPSITTILSMGGGNQHRMDFSLMANSSCWQKVIHWLLNKNGQKL